MISNNNEKVVLSLSFSLLAIGIVSTLLFSIQYMPVKDEWRIFPNYFNLDFWDALFTTHNRYLLVISNFFNYIDVQFFSYSERVGLVASWFALTIISLLYYFSLNRSGDVGPKLYNRAMLFVILAAFFSLQNHVTTLWSLHTAISFSGLFSLLTIYLITRDYEFSWATSALSVVAIPILAFLSYPNGGLVLIICILVFSLLKDGKRLILIPLSLVPYVFYLHTILDHGKASSTLLIDKLSHGALIGTASLSSFLPLPSTFVGNDRAVLGLLVGGFVIFSALILNIRLAMHYRALSRSERFLSLSLLFVVGNAFTIGVLRADFYTPTLEIAFAPRYVFWAIIGFVSLSSYAYLFFTRNNYSVAILIYVLIAIVAAMNFSHLNQHAFFTSLREEVKLSLLNGVQDPRLQTTFLFREMSILEKNVPILENNNAGVFSQYPAKFFSSSLSGYPLDQNQEICDAGVIKSERMQDGNYMIEGWSVFAGKRTPGRLVLFFDKQTHHLVGFAKNTKRKPHSMPSKYDDRKQWRSVLNTLRLDAFMPAFNFDYGFHGYSKLPSNDIVLALANEETLQPICVIISD